MIGLVIAAAIAVGALAFALTGGLDESADHGPRPLPRAWQRGANLTAYSPDGYGSPAAAAQLDRLAALGVDHVALVPLWYMTGADSSSIAPDPGRSSTDVALLAAAARARELGLSVAIAPHVDVDGGTFRGQIAPADRDAWFASYGEPLDRYASVAADAGAAELVVGTELTSMSGDEAAWRSLIDRARARFDGRLTYAANWVDEAEQINFWDALDSIGVNAYMPLPTTAKPPSVADLVAAWQPYVDRLAALHERWGLPISFTELGYQSRADAATAGGMGAAGPVDQGAQADAYEAAYRAMSEARWFRGIWWWDWSIDGTDPDGGGFTPQGKLAERVVAAHNLAGS